MARGSRPVVPIGARPLRTDPPTPTCTERAVMLPSSVLLPDTITVSPAAKSASLTEACFSISVVSVTLTGLLAV